MVKALDKPLYKKITPGVGSLALISDDGLGTAEQLAELLRKYGWKAIILRFPSIKTRTSEKSAQGMVYINIEDTEEHQFKQTIDGISEKYGHIGLFIYLHFQYQIENRSTYFIEEEKAAVKKVFFMCKYIYKHLNKSAQKGFAAFIAVTRLDGELGYTGGVDYGVVGGGLFGLVKTLDKEWENIICRAIDISPDIKPQEVAKCILDELGDPDIGINEVAYGPLGRIQLVCEDYLDFRKGRSKNQINDKTVFLVSGGGKGITAKCITGLAKKYGSTFILFGRSPLLESEPEWARNCYKEAELKERIVRWMSTRGEKPTLLKIQDAFSQVVSTRAIKNTMHEIEAVGGKCDYIALDIGDIDDLARKLQPVITKHGKIHGIIHGAGVLADKLIEKKSESDYDRVYGTKAGGLENLIRTVPNNDLDFLILFSSTAGFSGNVGQSDYAIANEILNKFSYKFKREHPLCHVVSINWGPWDGGMVTPELKKNFEMRNIPLIPIESGVQLFVEHVEYSNNSDVQIVIGAPFKDSKKSQEDKRVSGLLS